MLRARLRTGGGFLTGFLADDVESLGDRADNIFALAQPRWPAFSASTSGVLAQWSAAPAAALLQVGGGAIRTYVGCTVSSYAHCNYYFIHVWGEG